MNYAGQNVKNISIKKQSDVIVKKILSVEGTVNFPVDTEVLEAGQVLISTDSGKTWEIAASDAEANGVLCESLKSAGVGEIMVVGVAREKYLEGYVSAHKAHLFNNKIILK
ncbi:MAG: hypothetical protein PQJ49_05090 [Sphaerochaetaceae bacterium]|nr:hypothetical protein [Sphaerochaetaceae bacterium]